MGQESEPLPRPLLTVDYDWSGADGKFEWGVGTRVTVRQPHERLEDWVQVSGPDDSLSWYPEPLIKSGDGLSGQIETAYSDCVLSVRRMIATMVPRFRLWQSTGNCRSSGTRISANVRVSWDWWAHPVLTR